jgi:hypothetical protein
VTPDQIHQILGLIATTPAWHYAWEDRGQAPRGYAQGMTLAYAQIYEKWKAGDKYALEMAKANTHDADVDALAWYAGIFKIMKMDNSQDGADTLRHLWVLEIGLGMRESSGQYCCGRDRSADNVTADTAEAGLFQQSWNSNVASPLMLDLFENPPGDGLTPYFRQGVSCSAADWDNYGSGRGEEFQALAKGTPEFAAQFAAVGLRNIRTHWGPINRYEAEVRHDIDVLLQEVQAVVDAP